MNHHHPPKKGLSKAFLFFWVGGGIGGWANRFPWYKEFPNKWIPSCTCQIKDTKKLFDFLQWVLILNSKSPVCLPQVSLHDFHRVHSIHSAQLLDDAGCLGGDYDMPGVTGASPTCCCSRNLPALFLSDLVLHHPKRRLEKNFSDYLDATATGRFLELTDNWIMDNDNVQFNSDSEVGDDCHGWHIILYAGLSWFPWFPFAPVNKSPSFKGSAKWVRVHGFSHANEVALWVTKLFTARAG